MWHRASKSFFLIILTEIFLGGGGHLTAVGPISFRMALFCVAMLSTLVMLSKGRTISSDCWRLVAIFLLTISIGVIVAIIFQNPVTAILEDVKPLLYFLMLPFFALSIQEIELEEISKIVRACSVLL